MTFAIGPYEVTSAFYSNEEGTSVTVVTTTNGAVAVTTENPALWESLMQSGIEIAEMPGMSPRNQLLCQLQQLDCEMMMLAARVIEDLATSSGLTNTNARVADIVQRKQAARQELAALEN